MLCRNASDLSLEIGPEESSCNSLWGYNCIDSWTRGFCPRSYCFSCIRFGKQVAFHLP